MTRSDAAYNLQPALIEDAAATLASGRLMAQALCRHADDRQEALGQAFAYAAVAAWWERMAPADLPLVAPFAPVRQPLPDSAVALADALGAAAAQLSVGDAGYELSLLYTQLLPDALRAERGAYYTPVALTRHLIEQASAAGTDWTSCRVLDPACGGGAFLAPVAERIMRALPSCSPQILLRNIETRLQGYEIDPFAAWLSHVTLETVLLPVVSKAGRRLNPVVRVCDSLVQKPPARGFDLVIGNPPYGRVRLSDSQRARFKRSLFGHANLYGLFMDLAVQHTRPGGHIAFLTPTSFLGGEYFKQLRRLLTQEAPPVALDIVCSRRDVFPDVLQETLLATYRRASTPAPFPVSRLIATRQASLEIEAIGPVSFPAGEASDPWLLPRARTQLPLVRRLETMPSRLDDWGYKVSTGPLVWNRFKPQLAERPGKGRFPLIWAEAVTSGGEFIYRAERRNHAPYFTITPGDEWLMVTEPCVLLQRTTSKEQSRRLIAAALPEAFLRQHKAVVVENHLNMVRPIVQTPSVSPEAVAAFLNSAAADAAFRCASGSVAVSAYELETLPLPAPADMRKIERLISHGATRTAIETACAELYGMSAGA